MRIAVLSDVHANFPALQAVLEMVDRRGVDQILVAGDLVGYGGQPNECVSALIEAGAHCVLGNHDLFVLDRLPPTRFPALARRSAELHRAWLSSDNRAFLESLPDALSIGSVHMAHGSLDDPEEYVVDDRRAVELLARLPQVAPAADMLILGHTHQPWLVTPATGTLPHRGVVRTPAGFRLLNPGSVGQSRQRELRPRARSAIYDDANGTVEFLRVDYDVAASREVLRHHGLSDRCLHAPPSFRSTAVPAGRRVMASVTSRLLPRRRRERADA